MQTPPDHSRNPADPQPHEHDRDDDIPDTPYDEPPPIAIQDPPPPVTPGPYISQGGQLMTVIIGWILFGLIVGALAKLVMPGRDPGGIIVTMLIGIAGAMLGGFSVERWDSTAPGRPRVS